MLSSGTTEAIQKRIEVTDFDHPIVVAMLHFVYTGELEVGESQLVAMLEIASKYDIEALAAECFRRLVGSLEADSVVSVVRSVKGFRERESFKQLWNSLLTAL